MIFTKGNIRGAMELEDIKLGGYYWSKHPTTNTPVKVVGFKSTGPLKGLPIVQGTGQHGSKQPYTICNTNLSQNMVRY